VIVLTTTKAAAIPMHRPSLLAQEAGMVRLRGGSAGMLIEGRLLGL
jgi:hypothetical protein